MQKRCSNCFHLYDEDFGMCPNCGYSDEDDYSGTYSLHPGTLIHDRYIIGETLGIGGFGITYKAWDTQLDTVLAIKEYFPSGLVNRTTGNPNVFLVARKRENEFYYGKKRFLDEARNMAKFSGHRNIVNVFNFFEANNTAYIVMEYLEGMTLSQKLKADNAPLSVERGLAVAIDICDALTSIHKEKILHRDVSPDNIMLCNDGLIKLFDFGAARFSMDAVENSKVTVIVKPGFAPPEQYDNVNHQDARTDLYALGATLYYALTGIKPEESTERRIQDTLKAPNMLIPEIPEYVNNAILRAMAVEAQFRFESAEEFSKVLQRKIQVSTVEGERKKRKLRRLIGITAALLIIAAVAVTLAVRWNKPNLPGGEIEIWYRTGSVSEEAWSDIIEDFTDEYSKVHINAIGIPDAEYDSKIAEAAANGTLPELYESTGASADMLTEAENLNALFTHAKGMYMEGLDHNGCQYPTGLVIPVIYVNTSLGSIENTQDLAQLDTASQAAGSRMLVSKSAEAMYQTLYGEQAAAYASDTALDQFMSGKCMVYLGTNEDYLEIQSYLLLNGAGTYAVYMPETTVSIYDFGCLWSSTADGGNTKKIAHAFLEYLNSDIAQDYLNIRHYAESGCVPVSASALEKYMESYAELSGIAEYLKLPFAE